MRLGLQAHDADEVTGQVLFSLWKAMSGFRYDPAKSFSGYLQRVVRNHAVTYRERVLNRPGLTGAGDDLSRLPQPEAVADEVGGRLHADLVRLEQVLTAARRRVRKPTTWEAYRLTSIEDRAAADVAAELNMTVAAVYMAKSRVGAIVAEEVDHLG